MKSSWWPPKGQKERIQRLESSGPESPFVGPFRDVLLFLPARRRERIQSSAMHKRRFCRSCKMLVVLLLDYRWNGQQGWWPSALLPSLSIQAIRGSIHSAVFALLVLPRRRVEPPPPQKRLHASRAFTTSRDAADCRYSTGAAPPGSFQAICSVWRWRRGHRRIECWRRRRGACWAVAAARAALIP